MLEQAATLVLTHRFRRRTALTGEFVASHALHTVEALSALGLRSYRYRLRQPCWLERAATLTRHPLALLAADPPDLVELFEFENIERVSKSDAQRIWPRHLRILNPISEALLCREHALMCSTATGAGATSLSFWIRRPAGQKLDDMQHYWLRNHARLALGLVTAFDFDSYHQFHRLRLRDQAPVHAWCPSWRRSSFDGLACVNYRNRADLLRTAFHPEALAANFALVRDERHFTEPAATLVWIGTEHTHYSSEVVPCLASSA
jgi:hypothetical protein